MNIAEDFSTLGLYDGLQDCLKSDLINNATGIEYDKWTTLSGYNKDDTEPPTKEQIRKSLELGTKLYYNYFGLRIDAVALGNTGGGTVSASINADLDFSSDEEFQPKNRTCSPPIDFISDNTSGASCNITHGAPFIRRLYREDINDESDFVGYGVTSFLNAGAGASSAICRCEVLSFADAGTNQETAYVQVEDIHLICRVQGDLSLPETDATQFKAKNVVDVPPVANFSASIEISDFKFWSYA